MRKLSKQADNYFYSFDCYPTTPPVLDKGYCGICITGRALKGKRVCPQCFNDKCSKCTNKGAEGIRCSWNRVYTCNALLSPVFPKQKPEPPKYKPVSPREQRQTVKPNNLLDNLILFGVSVSDKDFPWVIRPGSATSLDRGAKYWQGSLDVIPKIRNDYWSEGIKSTLPIGESECREYLATHKRVLKTLCGRGPKRNNTRPLPNWIKTTGICPPVFPLQQPTGRPIQNEAYWDLVAGKCLPWWFIRERVDYQESLTEFWNEVLLNYTNKQPARFDERRLVLAHYDIVQYLYRAYIDLGIEWVFRKRRAQPRYPWTDAVKRANKFTREDVDFYHQKDTYKLVYDFFEALIRLPETVFFYQQWGVVPSHPHWLITPWIADERARQETPGMEGKSWYYHRCIKTKPSAQIRLKKLRGWQYTQRERKAKKKDYKDLVDAYQEIYSEKYHPLTAKESIEKFIYKFPCHSCTDYKLGTELDMYNGLTYQCTNESINRIVERFQKKKSIPLTVKLCPKVTKFLGVKRLKTPALAEHNINDPKKSGNVFDRESEYVVANIWELSEDVSLSRAYYVKGGVDDPKLPHQIIFDRPKKSSKHPCEKYGGMCGRKQAPDTTDCATCGPHTADGLRDKKTCVICGKHRKTSRAANVYFPACSWNCKKEYSQWLTSVPRKQSKDGEDS